MYCQNNLITKIDLNKEYSPSKCTHRFKDAQKPNEAVIENFIIKGKLGNFKNNLLRKKFLILILRCFLIFFRYRKSAPNLSS